MCNAIAGQLIVCFHRDDKAALDVMEQIRQGVIPHVTIIESLVDRLNDLNLKSRDSQYFFYRLAVPEGQEVFKIGYLQFFYKHAVLKAIAGGNMNNEVLSWTNLHMQVVPNSYLSLRQSSGAGVGFTATQDHDDYKKLCKVDQASSTAGSGKHVLVLDTGLDSSSSANVTESKNIVDPKNKTDVTDDNGHGTAVVEIINDIAPQTKFFVYKIVDEDGRASEWDTILALMAETYADIVNISIAFGLGDITCSVCGRESHASRSAVFENVLNELAKDVNAPLIVAAAGNGSLLDLAYPAKFSRVIAIASINKAKELSDFTNRGAVTEDGSVHDNVFVMPGGERTGKNDPTEYVGTAANGDRFWGTSFSAAYASGLIAALWSESNHSSKDAATFLDHLRSNTDKGLPNYLYTTHGNGLMQFK
jgi:hypothetical protein